MSTSRRDPKKKSAADKPPLRRAFVPTTALAKAVDFDADMMRVTLMDGRELAVPLVWFRRLAEATPEQRQRYKIGGGGVSIYWPALDEDLSVAGLMAGADTRSA